MLSFLRKTALTGLSIFTFSTAAFAQTPSQAQIEQFMSLPPEQQKALASAYGIDLDSVMPQGGGQSGNMQQAEVSGARGQSAPAASMPTDSASLFNQAPRYSAREIAPEDLKDLTQEDLMFFSQHGVLPPWSTNKDLKPFGYNAFNSHAETFQPADDIPPPSGYVLGPGDTLNIQLYGKKNETHSLTINRDGQVTFPTIGPVTIAGLTFDQFSDRIDEIVRNQMIGVKSSVSLGSLRTIRVFVLGEVQAPGSYVVSSLSTLTNAVVTSGGITEIGSIRDIQLKRKGKLVTSFDVYDLLLNGDTSNDSRLLPGDVIFVPTVGKTVSVDGDITRPAIYELKDENTVADVVKLAGGLLPTGYGKSTQLERITDDGERKIINIDVTAEKDQKIRVMNGDILTVPHAIDDIDDTVQLTGNVKRERGFAWEEGLRFTDLLPDVDRMGSKPDINAALIKRVDKKTREVRLIQFSPIDAWESPTSDSNPILENRDTIILFDYEADRSAGLLDVNQQLILQAKIGTPQQTVFAGGNVRFPGIYPFTSNATAQDLIQLAGGLLESSSGINAEITRQTFGHTHERTQTHITFDMRKENPVLRAGDALTIQKIPFWKKNKTVELKGEVISPGLYTILPGETLTQVIERAGGLTPYAFIEGTTYSREDLRELEKKQLEALKYDIQKEIASINLNKNSTRPSVSQQEADQIIQNIDKVQTPGRLVIDLQDILDDPKRYDFELEDGDLIEVPNFKPTVTVVGEVQLSTSHFFDSKISLNDYIKRSGGTKRTADKKRIYVVRANGRVIVPGKTSWFKRNAVALKPGDTIIVPIDSSRVDKLKVWSSVSQIMYQAALGITALKAL